LVFLSLDLVRFQEEVEAFAVQDSFLQEVEEALEALVVLLEDLVMLLEAAKPLAEVYLPASQPSHPVKMVVILVPDSILE
jgi:hypothetical protein